jgi:signal transduction histidine kinase
MVAERAADGGISGAITIGRDITKIKQAEQQLRELAVHLQSVREEEKARLAREIHDDLGSTLAALKLRLSHLLDFELAEEMKSTPLFARLESMSPLLESAIAATRRIITDMRPDVLDNLGLFAALKWQAEQFHKHTGIGCRIVCANDHGCVDCRGCVYQLDKTLSINLFRVFQEALTNIARHSGASSVAAEYRAGDDEIFLSVSDNGYGLPEGHTPASGSFGIRGMRERVGQLGGEIRFDTPSGGGLRVTVRVPMRAVAGDA